MNIKKKINLAHPKNPGGAPYLVEKDTIASLENHDSVVNTPTRTSHGL